MMFIIGLLLGVAAGILLRGIGFRRRFIKGLVRARSEGMETGKTYGYRWGYDEALSDMDCDHKQLRAQ